MATEMQTGIRHVLRHNGLLQENLEGKPTREEMNTAAQRFD